MMVRYWEINVSGWCNTQTVCGEEMTEDEAITATGANQKIAGHLKRYHVSNTLRQ